MSGKITEALKPNQTICCRTQKEAASGSTDVPLRSFSRADLESFDAKETHLSLLRSNPVLMTVLTAYTTKQKYTEIQVYVCVFNFSLHQL